MSEEHLRFELEEGVATLTLQRPEHDNAFSHEDEIHTDGVLDNPTTYESISPELVGRKRRIHAGKHSGITGLNAVLDGHGIRPTEEQSRRILDRVKASADQGTRITDEELLLIARGVLGEGGGDGGGRESG